MLFINRNEFANQSLNAFQCSTQFRFRLTIFQFQSNFSHFFSLHSIHRFIEIKQPLNVCGKMCVFFSFSNFQRNRYGSYSIFSTRKFQCTILRIDHEKIRFLALIYCVELLKLRFKKAMAALEEKKTNSIHLCIHGHERFSRTLPFNEKFRCKPSYSVYKNKTMTITIDLPLP